MSYGRLLFMVMTAAMFIVSAFAGLGGMDADGEPTVLVTFGDTDEDNAEATFTGSGSNLENTIRLPLNVTVDSATVSMKGADNGNGDFPAQVSMDVYLKDEKKIYEFDEPDMYSGLGSWGKQTYFSSNTEKSQISFKTEGTDTTTEIILPKGASVKSAKFDMVAQEEDALMPVRELTSTNDTVYDWDVDMVVDGDWVYVAYKTFNKVWVKDFHDPGIVVQGSDDGLIWSDPVQINPRDDWISPPGTGYWDWQPDLFAGSSGRLYCVWESNNSAVDPAGETGGFGDYDIFISWSDDPTTQDSWSDPVDITSPLEETYSIHNAYAKKRDDENKKQYFGLPQLTKSHDWWPQGIQYNGELYVVWTTNDTTSAGCPLTGGPGEGSDIMMAKSSNGQSWSLVGEVTKEGSTYDGDREGDHDPRLVIYDDKLWVFWFSNGSTFAHDDSYNIMARSYDAGGGGWSDIMEVNSEAGAQNYAWDKAPFPFVYDDDLYCVWYTHCLEYSDGIDADIVVKKWDGDDWQVIPTDPNYDNFKEYEITPMGDRTDHMDWYDKWPVATVYNNRIYVAWESSDGTHTYWSPPYDTDICYSSSEDGKIWTPLDLDTGAGLEITNEGLPSEVGADMDINLGVLGDSLIFGWNTQADPTSAHASSQYSDDADVVTRMYRDSSLPLPIRVDIGADGSYEWQGDLSDVTEEAEFKTAIQNYIDDADPTFTDSYGNEFVNVTAAIECEGVGKVIIDGLQVVYDYEVTIDDFAGEINKYIEKYGPAEVDEDGLVYVPMKIISASKGTVELYDLEVVYSFNPTINITIPDQYGAMSYGYFTIYWEDNDQDDNADITLYYSLRDIKRADLPQAFKDGELKQIPTGTSGDLSEDPDGEVGDTFLWDMTGLDDNNQSGKDYYVVAKITDGISTYWDISEGPVTLQLIPEPPTITLLTPLFMDEAGPVEYTITWTDEDRDSSATIDLYYSLKNKPNSQKTLIKGAEDIPEDPDEEEDDSFVWQTENVPAGLYYIHAYIDDGNATTYDISTGRVNTTRTAIDPVTDFKPERTHDDTPTLSWRGPPNPARERELYYLAIGTSYGADDVDTAIVSDTEYTVPSGLPLDYAHGTYYVTIKAQLGDSAVSPETTFVLEIYNTLPTVPEIKLTPRAPRTNDSLMVEIVNSSIDADEDPITYTYKWMVNGIELTDNTGTQISETQTSKGQRWEIFVIPNDGIEDGPAANLSVEILNTPPIPRITSPYSGQKFRDDQPIQFIGDASDVDGDDLTYMWESSLSGNLISDFAPFTEDNLTLDFARKLDAGEHTIAFVVTDGDDSSRVEISITVEGTGGEPVDGAGKLASNPLLWGVIVLAILAPIIILMVMWILARRRAAEEELEDLIDDPNAPKASSHQLYGDEFSEKSLDARLEGGDEPAGALQGGTPPALPPAGGPPGGPPPGAPSA